MDLLERDIDESVGRLSRYLSYKCVCTGESLDSAREDYQNVARNREIKETIPVAWRKLIEEQDSLLLDLISEKVENLCGYKPEPDLVADFLSRQSKGEIFEKPFEKPIDKPRRKQNDYESNPPVRDGNIGYVLRGQEVKARNARDAFIRIMEQFSRQDPNFCERFASRPRHGKKRRFIARTKEELYPGRPDLCQVASQQLTTGWWVGTNYSKGNFKKILRMACEVAGLRFGVDSIVYLGD